jgi:CrcB protein
MRGMLTVGFAGGFTTFSTFGWETVALLQRGDWLRAFLYALGSMLLGLAAVFAGWALGSSLLHARG